MRVEFAQAIIEEFQSRKDLVFLTGDLGFMALEEMQQALGKQFINAGIAEQNMVSMAASLALEGFTPIVYSISPFVTHRPFEQIRNDVCLHKLGVKLVGNGGGYGYGIMGATHHNLEDIGAMRVLSPMQVYVPVTPQDVKVAVHQMLNDPNPVYLRLNSAAPISSIPDFSAWRKLKSGSKAVVIGTGPVLNNLYSLPPSLLEDLEIWALGIFPAPAIPEELLQKIRATRKLITVEEHRQECGLNETLAAQLLKRGVPELRFESITALGYPNEVYGDQKFHQLESGLAGEGLEKRIRSVVYE